MVAVDVEVATVADAAGAEAQASVISTPTRVAALNATVSVSGVSSLNIERTDLPNGLTVLSETIPGVRSVAFGAWVRAATLHENASNMGVSHLLEHMVFKGTESRSAQQIALSLETLGGSLDAYTEREYTSFQARVLSTDLPVAVDVVGDLMFHPVLRDADLALERNVILEEISMVDDTPDDCIFDYHNSVLWPDHPHGYPILGTRETVSALKVDDLRSLLDRAYHPGRIVVAAAGAVSHAALLEALGSSGWADRSRGADTGFDVKPAVAVPAGVRYVKRGDIAQTHVVYGGAGIRHGDPRRYAFALLSMLLGEGMSSRLFQRVREELGLAYTVQTFQNSYADTGSHGVYLASAPGSAQQAVDAVREVLLRVVQEGVSEAELDAGRRQLRGQLVLSLEGVSSRLYRAASFALYNEEPRSVEDIIALIDAVDSAAVRSVAQDFFDPAQWTLVSLGPRAVR